MAPTSSPNPEEKKKLYMVPLASSSTKTTTRDSHQNKKGRLPTNITQIGAFACPLIRKKKSICRGENQLIEQ
jgi:hypothetical protein